MVYTYGPFVVCVKKIIFEDNQKPIIFEVTIIIAFFGIDQWEFIEKNNLIFIQKIDVR